MVGPLCGHEGPAVAQVSKETGVPLVMDAAGADNVTKWDRTPTVVRTAISSSQIGHPFGDYLYKELGARNVTFIGQDYTLGHEVTLGIVQTFKELGGKVAQIIWNPIGTKDYGPTVASIAPDSDASSRSSSAPTASACSRTGSTSAWTRSTRSTAATGCTRTCCRRSTTAPSA